MSVLVFAVWYLVVAVRLWRLAASTRGTEGEADRAAAVLPTRA